MRRALSATLAASALAAALGCRSATETPPRAGEREAGQERLSSSVPLSPTTVEAFPFDYASLPALEPTQMTGELESASLRFVPGSGGAELRMSGGLVAEIEIGTHQGRDDSDSGPDGRRLLRRGIATSTSSVTSTTGALPAWTPASGAGQLCGGTGGPSRARWQGYLHRSRTDEGLVFVCYEGELDPRTCTAKAERSWRVVARPLVGSALYGFRVKAGECSAPKLRHEERLALIGPRPLWIGTTDPFSQHEPQGQRTFTRIVLPVARAVSASVVLDTRAEDLRIFGAEARRSSPRAAEVLSYSVEIVWARAEPAPSAIGFMSIIRGNTETMNQHALSGIR